MLHSKTVILLFVAWLLFSVSCKKTDPAVSEPDDELTLVIPDGYPQPVYQFQNNPLTKEGFELGKKLFYDPVLSKDNSISCGSCHQQFAAFSHSGHKVSHGIYGLFGKRNAPGLFNLIWQPTMMWDGGVTQLDLQPMAPITNPIEMDETLPHVVAKLQADPQYTQQFKNVFGTDSITSALMFKAMAQFLGMLNSTNSRYDQYERGEAVLSADELSGLQLFRTNCESCHREPFFTDFSYRNNGLDTAFADSGRAVITLVADDLGKFKVPSLRNIALTAPYMHDGRFETLSSVVHHYRNGVENSSTLDSSLTAGISLTDEEASKLIDFLHTLTDVSFITDPRFKEPQK